MNTRFLCLFLLLNLAAPSLVAAETEVTTLGPGAKAPDFNLPAVDGRNYSLTDFSESKVLVIVFTCNHCPTAQYYEGRIKQLVTDYKAKGVAILGISPNDPKAVRPDELGYTDLGDSFEEMKVRARDREFNFPYLFAGSEHEPVSVAYGPVATPHAFVFDAERKLRYVGRIDDSEREAFVRVRDLRNALDALLAGREPEVKQTKVFGCSIKWSSKQAWGRQFYEKLAGEPVNVELAKSDDLRALRVNEANKNDKAKLRLVNFWATWCGPCITEFPELMMINRMYRQRDFELVTVAANFPDEKEEVLKFLKKQQASNRNLMFGDTDKYKLMEAFDRDWTGALPYTMLINPAGEVLYRKQGSIEPLELKRLIVKELNARKPW